MTVWCHLLCKLQKNKLLILNNYFFIKGFSFFLMSSGVRSDIKLTGTFQAQSKEAVIIHVSRLYANNFFFQGTHIHNIGFLTFGYKKAQMSSLTPHHYSLCILINSNNLQEKKAFGRTSKSQSPEYWCWIAIRCCRILFLVTSFRLGWVMQNPTNRLDQN